MGPLADTLLLGFPLLLVYLCRMAFVAKRRPPLPPGPPPLPFVESLFDIPRTAPWIAYRDLCKKYGNLVCLRALGQTIVVIGDAQTAVDLLEKRSANYVDRPEFKPARLIGWDWNFVFARYGQWWRDRRRVFWQHFRPDATNQYREHQQQGVRRLVSSLLASPEKLNEHLRDAVSAIVLGTLYGMEVVENDPNVAIFAKGQESVEFLIANSSWLEYLPTVLGHLPTWLQANTGILRQLAEIRDAVSSIYNTPWKHAKDALRRGDGQTCIAHHMLERIAQSDDEVAAVQEVVCKDVVGTAYAGERALYNQIATMQRFFVAMSLYPDVQKLAQAELDSVVGRSRMPEPEDRDRLPYVDALVKETLRWYPAVPMGVARRVMENDEYNGYLIPGGATVMVNEWAIMHDEKMYPDPERFSPERHLKGPETLDPTSVVFGMGRRICPGRYFADTTMFLLIASVLQLFDISPRLDDHSRPVLTEARPTTGIISHLENWWHCTVKPRSLETEKLIRDLP
ncbi:cytochrome P450 [Lentinus tigrinus ALCF2SS1-7]|uniref:cytochrome P450 n=1 Tax=Lentinus tigrinus ALCF2SS1-7 TaxID=1328758 RepID=UPI001165D540|nr:cytochrome P450 [Lentinus tigrinus ALCF2SS1-7]